MKFACHSCLMSFELEDYPNAREECPCCHSKKSCEEEYLIVIKHISEDPDFVQAMIDLKQKDPIEYTLKVSQLMNSKRAMSKQESTDNTPKCPTCGSSNIEKITAGQKVLGGAIFGLFSSNVRKSMRCHNCGYKW